MEAKYLPMQPDQLNKVKVDSVKYMTGHPRVYRFDAKTGKIQDHNGSNLMPKNTNSLLITPISYRVFFGELFEYSPRQWVELFFLNAAAEVCALLFHGFSVQEFEESCADLYYEEAAVNEVSFEIVPMQKEKTIVGGENDGKRVKYFIAAFQVKVLKGAVIKKPAAILESLPPVFRKGSLRKLHEMERWLGYPENLTPPQELKEETGKKADEEAAAPAG